MTEPHDLIIEHLKRIQDRLGRLEEGQDAMRADIRGIKGHMASFMAVEAAQDMTIAGLSARIDRTPRRLDLVEG